MSFVRTLTTQLPHTTLPRGVGFPVGLGERVFAEWTELKCKSSTRTA